MLSKNVKNWIQCSISKQTEFCNSTVHHPLLATLKNKKVLYFACSECFPCSHVLAFALPLVLSFLINNQNWLSFYETCQSCFQVFREHTHNATLDKKKKLASEEIKLQCLPRFQFLLIGPLLWNWHWAVCKSLNYSRFTSSLKCINHVQGTTKDTRCKRNSNISASNACLNRTTMGKNVLCVNGPLDLFSLLFVVFFSVFC